MKGIPDWSFVFFCKYSVYVILKNSFEISYLSYWSLFNMDNILLLGGLKKQNKTKKPFTWD